MNFLANPVNGPTSSANGSKFPLPTVETNETTHHWVGSLPPCFALPSSSLLFFEIMKLSHRQSSIYSSSVVTLGITQEDDDIEFG